MFTFCQSSFNTSHVPTFNYLLHFSPAHIRRSVCSVILRRFHDYDNRLVRILHASHVPASLPVFNLSWHPFSSEQVSDPVPLHRAFNRNRWTALMPICERTLRVWYTTRRVENECSLTHHSFTQRFSYLSHCATRTMSDERVSSFDSECTNNSVHWFGQCTIQARRNRNIPAFGTFFTRAKCPKRSHSERCFADIPRTLGQTEPTGWAMRVQCWVLAVFIGVLGEIYQRNISLAANLSFTSALDLHLNRRGWALPVRYKSVNDEDAHIYMACKRKRNGPGVTNE